MIGVPIGWIHSKGCAILGPSASEEALSQHQQAFLVENAGDVTPVVRRALSLLAAGGGAGTVSISTERVLRDRLFQAAFGADRARFDAALKDLRGAGFSHDRLAYEVIPDLARRLGAGWVEDTLSFADVTLGSARLQTALSRMPEDVGLATACYNGQRMNCLVLSPKTAQHTMGALVLARQLRQVGQQVVVDLEADAASLQARPRGVVFDAIMISASRAESSEGLRALVDLCRLHWPQSRIILGGSICEMKDCRVTSIGADLVTNQWQAALDLCI